jgi:hypothetical protein
MREKRGQISPITVRARDIGGGIIHYDVIDGYHRSYGFLRNGQEYAKAVVIYGCSDEELYDLRVLAANSVRSLRFARVANWMQLSFRQTEWFIKKGLSLSSAFSLVVMDSPGTRLNLTSEEAIKLKEWVKAKAALWNQPVASIWDTMRIVEAAAPDLVQRVRVGGGGAKSKTGELNPTLLKAIVYPLAGEYDLQRKVAQTVLENQMGKDEAYVLAQAVSQKNDDPERIKLILRNPYKMVPGLDRLEQHSVGYRAQRLKEQSPRYVKIFWWRTFPELTSQEHDLLCCVFDDGLLLEKAANKLKISKTLAFELVQSGILKYSEFIRQKHTSKRQ